MPNNFNNSFNWRVPLRTGRKHGWEHHGKKGTLVRRLLGVLDLWASNDKRHRFIFCSSREGLLKQVNAGKNREQYSMTQLEQVLHELRERHIISPYFTAYDGRYGFVMQPHDGRARREGSLCVLYQPRNPDYKHDITSQFSPYDAPRGCGPGAPRVRTGCAEGAVTGAVTGAVKSQKGCGEGCGEGCADELEQIYKNPELAEAYAEKWLAERGLVGTPKLLKRCKHGSLEADKQTRTENGRGQEEIEEQGNSKPKSKGDVSSSLSLEPNTENRTPKTRDHEGRYKPVLSPNDYKLEKIAKTFVHESPYTDAEIAKMHSKSGRQPCQEINFRTGELQVINRLESERIEMGFTVLAPCTVSGSDSQGQTGKIVWHKPHHTSPIH